LASFFVILAIANVTEEACCGCTDTSPDSFCNPECDDAVCEYDPYCCDVEWDSICADGAECECNGEDGCFIYSEPYYNNNYGDDSCGDYDDGDDGDYGYDDDCNCDEICYGNEPEEWEFEYEEVPPCIINNCGEQLDKCASDEACVTGLENVVNDCYNSDEDPQQCMDGLIADTQNAGFKSACEENEECATDLKALGECVANSANYGFCDQEEYKKLKLKSVLKTVKKKSRKLKRKSSAKKHKSKRSKKKGKKGKKKKRGKRKSKLRKSSRKLLNEDGTEYEGSDEYDSQYDQYENPENDYGCYCECGEEEEEIPDCILNACGEQLYACGSIDDCIDGVEGVIQQCYEDNDSPQQCMDELMAEAGSAQAIQLCNGNEEAGAALQALGTCVINSANYGDCSEDEYKKLKLKALVKATKKVRARKTAAASKKKKRSRARVSRKRLNLRRLRKGYRARPKARSRRAVSRRQRGARASRRKLLSSERQRRERPRPRSRAATGQRLKRKRALAKRERARRVRSEKLKSRKRQRRSRRKLLSGDGGGCCECTDEDEVDGPKCNKECDKTICGYDPYCCKVEWDWICAEAAQYECSGEEPGSYYDYGDYDYYGDYYGSYGDYYGDYDDYEYYGDYYGSYGDYDYGDYSGSYDYGDYEDYEDYGDYGSYGDDYEYGDSYDYEDYGDYDSYGTGGVYDYYYDYYSPSSYDYYDIDGDEYNYDYGDSYDMGDYYGSDYEDYDYTDYYGSDSYYPPKKRGERKQESRRSLLAQKSRRQRRQRPRSRVSRQQGLRKRALEKRERQRRARSLKGKRARARRQRLQRRARR